MKMFGITFGMLVGLGLFVAGCGENGGGGAGAIGHGGSTMEFAIHGDMLYLIAGSRIKTLDIHEPRDSFEVSDVVVGWDIETLFPYEGYLYVGSETGVYLYDLIDPTTPQYLSDVQHLRSCDPVVAEGSLAYVTLRSGFGCPGSSNQLEIIDFSDPVQPRVVQQHSMTEPSGLDVDNGLLFICDGWSGLKMLNTDSEGRVVEIDHKTIECQDVIAEEGVLIVTSESLGIVQYSYDQFRLSFLSLIPVNDPH